MNAKMKATFAVAIVAMMVFAAAGATTYSWFSDTEETDITVSTAEVNIVGGFTKVSVGESLDTSAGIDKLGDLSITNMVADRTVNATYTVTNYSTINTQYRAYIVVSGLDDNQMDQVSVEVGGKNVEFIAGIGYFVGNAISGKDLSAANSEEGDRIEYGFVISTSDVIDNSFPGFSMKVVVEAYQYGYNYSAPVFMDEGEVSFGDVAGKNVKVEGTSAYVGDAVSVPFTMEFDQGASTMISNSTLSVKAVESPSGNFIIGSEANAVVLDIKINGNDATVVDHINKKEIYILWNDGEYSYHIFATEYDLETLIGYAESVK